MLKSVDLKNFRGFRDHTVDFTPFCLLIGQNNAGKTTLIEALRVLSAALNKAPTASFMMAPDFLLPDISGPVFKFSVDTLDIEHRGIHYNYRVETPAIIKARYNNNCSITVAVGQDDSEIYCQLSLPGGIKVNSRSKFKADRFRGIYVMPPVGALLAEETQRDKKYLYRHINGYLSYRHIRNQMADMPEEFDKFREMLEETWSTNLQVGELEYGVGEKQNLYGLTIRDGPFVSEMALVGSGLQAWIQTLWFLARVDSNSTVVLDEPDVYLHADLQKKLIKILSAERYRQTIVATHSMEMIADVAPSEIVSVTKRSDRSRTLSSSAQAQKAVETIGTNLNIQLSKLANAGRIIFVEGKDYAFLDQVAYKLGNSFYDRFSKLPHFPVGGMNNWPRAAMAAKAFHSTSDGKVCSTMFIDRDYKPNDLLDDVCNRASADNLDVVVWSRKEIENFFLDPVVIHSYLENRAREAVSIDEVTALVSSVIDALFSDLPEMIADGYQAADRKVALPTAMKRAKEYISERVASGVSKADLICGKQALTDISGRSQVKWKVPISAMSLCRHMQREQVPEEMLNAVVDLVD